MTICSRCKKEITDSFAGMCIDCVANHRHIEWINNDIVEIGGNLYTWVRVQNTDRWIVLDTSVFYKLMKESDCSFILELREDKDYEIYISDSDVKFGDKIKEIYGKSIKFAPSAYDFRLPFNMLHK